MNQQLSKKNAAIAVAALGSEEKREKFFDGMRDAYKQRNVSVLEKAKNIFSAYVHAPIILRNEFNRGRDAFASAVQAFTPTTNIDEMITDSFDVFREFNNVDNRAMQAFRTRGFDPNRSFFEIADVSNGIVVDKVEEGEAVKYSTISSARTPIYTQEYGAGFQYPWRMIEDREFESLIDLTREFAIGIANNQGEVLYGALYAAAGANPASPVAYAAGTTDHERLIKTINNGFAQMASDLQDVREFDAATTPGLIFCNGDDATTARFNAAVNYNTVYGGPTSESAITSRQLTVLPTFKAGLAANEAMLVLPGRKNIMAEKVAPSTYMEQDIDHFSNKMTVRHSFAVVCGDVRQAIIIATA